MNSLNEIERQIKLKTDHKDRTIRGIWGIDCLFNPANNGRVFDYKILISQTLGQGCAYSTHDQYQNDKLLSYIGRDFLDCNICDTALKVSLMDSIYGLLYPPKNFTRQSLDANSEKKMKWRTNIILNEADKLLGGLCKKRIVNVGVVGDILLSFQREGAHICGTDFDKSIQDEQVFDDIQIFDGSRTLSEIATADLAIVTGMTISSNTIDDILLCARENKTKIIVYAETGANLSNYYIQAGVDVYVSEHFPFYIFNGNSIIDICTS